MSASPPPRSIDKRIGLHKLEVLSVVVEEGGVSRAADRLYVAQPVVSAHIRSLEERLGTKIFYREGRRIHLTEAGHAVHEWADDVLTRTKELERLLAGFDEGLHGTIAIGASMTMGSYRLTPVLSRFRSSHPHIDLKLGISDTQHAIEDTRGGAFDFAVVVFTPGLSVPGMHVEQVGMEEMILVGAPALVASDEPVGVEELVALPFIDTPGRFVDSQLHMHGIHSRKIVLELGHPEAMKRAARDGVGLAFMFRNAVHEDLASGALREIPLRDMTFTFPVYVVYRKGRTFAPSHLELIDRIREDLAA